jgi:6-phosphogluconolactonase (cycloisomerase 2 family)
LIIYAKKENPRFIQRLSEEPKKIKFINDEGQEVEGSHYLESRGEYVIPRIQEINGELKFLNKQEAIDKAIESGNYLKMDPEEAIIFAEQYKQGWPEFFKQFKNGGVVTDSLEKEEST